MATTSGLALFARRAKQLKDDGGVGPATLKQYIRTALGPQCGLSDTLMWLVRQPNGPPEGRRGHNKLRINTCRLGRSTRAQMTTDRVWSSLPLSCYWYVGTSLEGGKGKTHSSPSSHIRRVQNTTTCLVTRMGRRFCLVVIMPS